MTRYLVSTALMFVAACSKSDDQPATNSASANRPAGASLMSGDGKEVGLVALSEDKNGITVKVEAAGLTPGAHGLHLHTVGRCDGPKFESAGPHWNPTGKKHGRDNPQGPHLGDLADLEVGTDGRGTATTQIPGTSLKGGDHPLIDLDGAALVVHAKADDQKTDPSGASGDRIACAILEG